MGTLETARLIVRLDAIAANYRLCGELAAPATVAGVVKADAYGLGAAPVARKLAAAGCDTFFVARLEEGIALRPIVPAARIFVLDGLQGDGAPAFIAHRLIPVLNSLEEIAAWSAAARARSSELMNVWARARDVESRRSSNVCNGWKADITRHRWYASPA